MEDKLCRCFGVEHPFKAEKVAVGSCKCSRIWGARWIGSVCPVCNRRIVEQHVRCYGYAPGLPEPAPEKKKEGEAPVPVETVTPPVRS